MNNPAYDQDVGIESSEEQILSINSGSRLKSPQIPLSRKTHLGQIQNSSNIAGSNNQTMYQVGDTEATGDESTFNIMQQTQDPHGMGSNIGDHTALMNVIKGSIGTGLLSMPAVVYRSGLVLGVVGIFGMGMLSLYLMRMLVHIATDMRIRYNLDRSKMDYTETVFQVFKHGPPQLRKYKGKLKHLVNVFLIITQIGFCCVYILFITQNLQLMLGYLIPHGKELIETKGFTWVIGLCITLLLLPCSLIQNLKHLSIPAMIANVATVLGLALVYVYCMLDLQPWQNLPLVSDYSSLLVAFGIIIYAFEAISLVLPIENKMQTPESYMPTFGVLNTGMIVVICIYTALGFFGFLHFGEDTPASITYGIPNDILWVSPVKPLFIFAVFVSYLIQFYVPGHIFARLMEKIVCHREGHEPLRKRNVNLMRIGLVLMTYVIAMSIPHLDLMISLIGSLSSAMLALILPPILDMVHRYQFRRLPEDHFLWHMCLNTVLALFGLFGFFGGTIVTILQIVEVMIKGN